VTAAWRRPEVAQLAAGVALLALVLFGQQAYGLATSGARLDPSLRDPAQPVDVVVVLAFQPERFHNERLAAYGVFGGRDRAVNRIRLQRVTPENLRRLARLAWVERIEPRR
jgi:hypothetical protein